MEILRTKTAAGWLPVALADMDAVLLDHAHCEKKAAVAAMALVNQYPERDVLVRRCVGLAREELRHFQAVHRLVLARGRSLGRDRGDPYVQRLLVAVRQPSPQRLMDRLLVSALIEARSCERLALLGAALPEPALAEFYSQLATAEAGHARLFVRLALLYDDRAAVLARLAVLAALEATVAAELPLEPRIH